MLGAIILAAGQSRRMGCEKLLLPVGGRKLLETTVDAVAESFADGIIVVTKKSVAQAIARREAVVYLINEQPERGQATSLKIAVAYLKEHAPECQGVLVFLGDQPLVSRALVEEIRRVLSENPDKIVVPEFEGQRGHPVAFGKCWLPELLKISGDAGGRSVIKKYPEAVIKIPGAENCVLDADTPEDYRCLLEYYEREWSE